MPPDARMAGGAGASDIQRARDRALHRRGFSLGMPSAIIGELARHLRSTQRLWPRGRHAMSTIAIAILVLLAVAGASGYLSFRRDLGTGPAGKLGLVLVGPCLAAALWCLWWSS
jgi:hypothetical protein